MDNVFEADHAVTIGVEFGSFGIEIEGKIIKMQIWDTAGQDSYKSVTRIFYRGAHCVFLTYDITREETFNSCQEWYRELKAHAAENAMIYLIGNKSDMPGRQVAFERAVEFAQKN